jgi:cysteine desulfurase
MCVPHDIINGSIRFSFGKDNTMADVDKVMEVLPKVVDKLRAMSAIGPDKEIKKDVFTKGH